MRTPQILLFILFLGFGLSGLQAQKPSENLWSDAALKQLPDQSLRRIIPQKYRCLHLDFPAMKEVLAAAPERFGESQKKSNVIISLPLPDGGSMHFRVYDAPIMHPELAARYPEIRSFVGQGIEDPSAIVRFDHTPKGFHAMILSADKGTIFIDPYAEGHTDYYISYFKKDFTKQQDEFSCHVNELLENNKKPAPTAGLKMAGDCQLRTYRLALACTGEYAQYHGGTVAGALAAMNTTMTRVNGVFERDAAITMQLVANDDQLIFLDPATDPYSNNNGSAMLGQNQTTCDDIIGSANYDIGHVFSTGGGGIAYLESPCDASIKAGGVTGQANPVGDPFDIDYVAHEMGHQYGGRHTQNNDCNRDNSASYEPGSASTIMGYAGICPPDIQAHSDDYYHTNSIILMGNFVTGAGNACPTVTNTGNNPPVANAGADYTIPKSTPFVLQGTGSDPDGDALTYCWEQYDKQVAPMPPQAGSTTGPAFRSFGPSSSNMRYLPKLEEVVNNTSPTWEVLANTGRTYTFRLTVRDNFAGAGCTDDDEMIVTVDGSSGPFLVTTPNSPAVSWTAGTMETVTWDVAGTNGGAVNTPNVDILLSLDGGYTYPVILATAVPNDGSEMVLVPNMPTDSARVQVRGSGNIFYDISDANFSITGGNDNDFTVSIANPQIEACQGLPTGTVVNIGIVGAYSGNVSLSANGLPASLSVSFTPNPVAAPGISEMVIDNTASVSPGSYPFEVSGTDGTNTHIANATLIVLPGAPAQVALIAPANGATNVPPSPTLSWSAAPNAGMYYIELATDSLFTNVVESANVSDTTYNAGPLTPDSTYYWHVAAQNSCGVSDFQAAFSFTVGPIEPGLCLPPLNSSATTTANTASLNWSPIFGAAKYVIRYRPVGTTTWKRRNTLVNFITLVGLTPATEYEYQIRVRCETGLTDWSELFFFTTQEGMDQTECTNLTPIEPVQTTPNSAVISWNAVPGAFLYRLSYRAAGTNDPWKRINSPDTMVFISNLLPQTEYEYIVKTLCVFGWTPWSDSYFFTTAGVLLNQEQNSGSSVAAQTDRTQSYTTEDLKLFPNPATDRLTIQWPYQSREDEVGISIRDLSGKLLYTSYSTQNELEISLDKWPAGIYILQLTREGQAPLIRRFVKK